MVCLARPQAKGPQTLTGTGPPRVPRPAASVYTKLLCRDLRRPREKADVRRSRLMANLSAWSALIITGCATVLHAHTLRTLFRTMHHAHACLTWRHTSTPDPPPSASASASAKWFCRTPVLPVSCSSRSGPRASLHRARSRAGHGGVIIRPHLGRLMERLMERGDYHCHCHFERNMPTRDLLLAHLDNIGMLQRIRHRPQSAPTHQDVRS